MEFSVLGVTVLLPLLWVLMAAFDVQRGLYGVSAAAREATRAFTLQESVGAGQAEAQRVAELALEDQGIDLSLTTIPAIRCADAKGRESQAHCLQPNSSASIKVTYKVEIPFWPDMFGVKPNLPVSSEHTTPYGQYRTGAG